MPEITEEIVQQIKEWLSASGVSFFREMQEKHGTVSPVLIECGIPHPVHFREGMQVRNKLRDITKYSWTDHEYDDLWTTVIEKAIV